MLGYLFADIICSEKRTVFPSAQGKLCGADNVQGQVSEHIVKTNGGYCVYYPSNVFRNTKIGEYHSQFYLGYIQSRDALRPITRERNYLMDCKSSYVGEGSFYVPVRC